MLSIVKLNVKFYESFYFTFSYLIIAAEMAKFYFYYFCVLND